MGAMIGIHQQSGQIRAYLAFPKTPTYKGGVIILHEVWGLTEQIKNVAERFAAQGYYTLAPDLFSTEDTNRELSKELQRAVFSEDPKERAAVQHQIRALLEPTNTPQFASLLLSRVESCFEYVYNQPLVHQKVAVVGFSFGGNYIYEVTMRESRLKAAVSFYGRENYLELELKHIHCPILAFYGGQDRPLMMELPKVKTRMQHANVVFTPVVYDHAGHAFFNEANRLAYNQQAADDAWRRTMSFLTRYMY